MVPRRKGLVHIARTCAGGPQSPWQGYRYSPFIGHRTAYHAKPANDHYGNATGTMKTPAHSHAMCTRPFSPPLEGPACRGTRLRAYQLVSVGEGMQTLEGQQYAYSLQQ